MRPPRLLPYYGYQLSYLSSSGKFSSESAVPLFQESYSFIWLSSFVSRINLVELMTPSRRCSRTCNTIFCGLICRRCRLLTLRDLFPKNRTNRKTLIRNRYTYPCKTAEYQNKLLRAVTRTDYIGDFMTRPAAAQAIQKQDEVVLLYVLEHH